MIANKPSSEILDELMSEVKSMREEFSLQIGKYSEINDLEDRIDNLEKRVQKLEEVKQ